MQDAVETDLESQVRSRVLAMSGKLQFAGGTRQAEACRTSMLYGHRRSDRHRIKQLFDIPVVQRDTTPGPVSLRAIAVNEQLASQPRVLRRHAFLLKRPRYLIVLGATYQPVAKTSLGVPQIRV